MRFTTCQTCKALPTTTWQVIRKLVQLCARRFRESLLILVNSRPKSWQFCESAQNLSATGTRSTFFLALPSKKSMQTTGSFQKRPLKPPILPSYPNHPVRFRCSSMEIPLPNAFVLRQKLQSYRGIHRAYSSNTFFF